MLKFNLPLTRREFLDLNYQEEEVRHPFCDIDAVKPGPGKKR
jgi:hypothetical protein